MLRAQSTQQQLELKATVKPLNLVDSEQLHSTAACCRFVYEEEGHPEDFFVPYLWALLVPRLPVSWDTSTFRLFSL